MQRQGPSGVVLDSAHHILLGEVAPKMSSDKHCTRNTSSVWISSQVIVDLSVNGTHKATVELREVHQAQR